MGEVLKIRVDGEEVAAEPGQTVAGVLLGMGRRSWRTTRGEGRPRGVFCGIGVCFDCLVVVNGVPDVRACRRRVADGDDVRAQHGAELPS
ncbi:(2Fe-2S)-binding protein [Nocardiopsis potens]|uniref:(2Fe-2S)-binding protein n=1 Tax=Nocardiopsis potens TaxID=1246458 RepID=UPI00034A999F|nr:(2Fe-2S)-binding protein [Nocardiopsis potens]